LKREWCSLWCREYDRLFLGFQCTELEGDILFVDALDEDCAAEIGDRLSLHIAIIAGEILHAEIAAVIVLLGVLNLRPHTAAPGRVGTKPVNLH